MRIHSYLQSAEQILTQYNGDQPFAAWLKQFFAANKKYGSRDRKQVAHLCYSYFRLGKAFATLPTEERILISLFLTSTEPNAYLQELKPRWNEETGEGVDVKFRAVGAEEEWRSVFPWINELSPKIEAKAFALSFLVQPDLYLRLRPSKAGPVRRKLEEAGISFNEKAPNCLALANGTKVEEVVKIDEEAVIQDYSSQQVLQPLLEVKEGSSGVLYAWDCCAASGGKSILLYDLFPRVELTVSDIRQSIIHNLQSRFRRAGIGNYKSFVGDVSSPQFSTRQRFDVIICDAPCSGSGTWSRTPEQLYHFEPTRIDHYASLQKSIALNAHRALKPGGYLMYITCSVFRKENEDVVQYLQEHTSLQLLSARYYAGYQSKADTLFVALFSL